MAELTVSKCNEQQQQEEEEEELVVNKIQIDDDDDDAATVTGNNKIAAQQQQQLEGKKKRLLEELESVFTTIATPKPNSLGFSNIEVIDETALLDCIPKPRRKPSKMKTNKNNTGSSSTDKMMMMKKKKKEYSREMMESMRFVNVSQQHKFWKTIYTALQSAFADEYDTLVVAAAAHNNNRHTPLPFLPNKKPILTGVGATNGRCRYVNVFVHWTFKNESAKGTWKKI